MPVQSENINFIPDKIVNERKVRHTKLVGTRVTIILLSIIAIVSGAIFYYNYTVTKQIDKYKSDTEDRKKSIESLKRFGEEGYKLGVRLENIGKVVKDRPIGSAIMSQIKKRLPEGVQVSDWTYNPSQGLILKGSSKSTYVPIDLFKDNLLSANPDNSPSPFTEVRLTNAAYDKSDGLVQFSITVSVDKSKLVSDVTPEELLPVVQTQDGTNTEQQPTTE